MTETSEPWLVYAGTYYPTAFSDVTKAGIAKYSESGGKLKLMFALKRPPSEALAWIGKDVHGSRVIQDLSPLEVAGLIQKARAVLICDAPEHRALLLTKVTHALHSNKPILALTSPQSTTGDVVRAAGGVVADSSSVESITEGFRQLDQLLDDNAQLCASIRKQQQARARFSAERVSSDSIAVLAYAARRYAWSMNKTQAEPEPPKIEKWP
jgi:glycosyltransferase involved in cell wall biosynthesis